MQCCNGIESVRTESVRANAAGGGMEPWLLHFEEYSADEGGVLLRSQRFSARRASLKVEEGGFRAVTVGSLARRGLS
jgi:hypothetical protein